MVLVTQIRSIANWVNVRQAGALELVIIQVKVKVKVKVNVKV